MPFPLTHLCVAYRILEKRPSPAPEQFILGCIAPDAVHFRAEFQGATKALIGPAKKVTHLCPVSGEKWGKVTDVNGWIQCVKAFLRANPNDPFAAGYAVHVLTDIFNHIGPWHEFNTEYPDEAAKGYASDYYRDLRNIDLRIYRELFNGSEIEGLLQNSTPLDMPGLVTAAEQRAGRDSLLYTSYVDAPENVDTSTCFYITYEQTLAFINDAADFCIRIMSEI